MFCVWMMVGNNEIAAAAGKDNSNTINKKIMTRTIQAAVNHSGM